MSGIRLLFLTLFLALLPFTARAETAGVTSAEFPQKMQGFWTLPDCRNPERFAVYSRFFRLTIEPEGIWLDRILSVQEEDKFSRIRAGEQTLLAHTTNDGILELTEPENPHDYSKGVPWDELKMRGSYREFTRCYEIEPKNHEAGVEAMEYLDEISELCTSGYSEGCAPFLFTAADKDRSNKLGEKEVSDFLEKISYLAAVSRGPIMQNQLEEEMAPAYKYAPVLARILVIGRDANGSQSLESNELADLHTNFPQHEAADYFSEKVRSLTLIFRNPSLLLRKPAMALTVNRAHQEPLPPSLSDRSLQPQGQSAE